MKTNTPAPVLVFDVNETLLDITILEPLFDRLFGDSRVLREWFPELILYSQVLTTTEQYMPFGELASVVLQMVATNHGVAINERDVTEFRHLFGQMPAHEDVKPALEKLRQSGFKLVTLTNSAPAPSPTPLENAGISHYFDHHFNVDTVRKFKPHPAVYEMVASQLQLQTRQLCMIACHVWDTIGAQSAGCQGAFVSRTHNSTLSFPETAQPNYLSINLLDLADQFLDQ